MTSPFASLPSPYGGLGNLSEARIARKRDDVFLPREFADLGGEDQLLRVLRGLVREGRLVRLGYGVYGRAVVSQLSGEPISTASMASLARRARLSPSSAWSGSRPRPSEPTTKAAPLSMQHTRVRWEN